MKSTQRLHIFLTLGFAWSLLRCGLESSQSLYYSSERNKAQVAKVGAEMVKWTDIYRSGIFGNSGRTLSQKLIYTGKQGRAIRILYREESSESTRPLYSQELFYDIAEDSLITFKNVKIKVIEATATAVRFSVLESPAYGPRSGKESP
jgi:hypothetical protein